MIAFAFTFPAGRYHATPWGRNANEADVAWPPEPVRILRALIATWWRKADHQTFPKSVLDGLVDALAVEPPLFRLPDAVHSHVRAYMPAPVQKTLIYDGFFRLDRDTPLIAVWPNAVLTPEQHALAAHLLERIGYLGRAESWAEAQIVEARYGELNAGPRELAGQDIVGTDGEVLQLHIDGDAVPVDITAVVTPQRWSEIQARLLNGLQGKKMSKRERDFVGTTLPERLADALAVDTSQWQKAGWSSPPPLRKVVYDRPAVGPLPPRRSPVRSTRRTGQADPTVARFVLAGRPRPRVEDTVRIAEIMRLAAMAKFGWETVEGKRRPKTPGVISGYGEDGKPLRDYSHAHAFWLPEDADRDGEIDHVIVYAAAGLNGECRQKLDRITRLWVEKHGRNEDEESAVGGRKECRLALEGFGRPSDFAAASALLGCSSRWISTTPYLTPWHAKKGFGWADQIARELKTRGLPELSEAPRDRDVIPINGRDRRPLHFHRFRSRHGLRQPDTLGRFLELTFKNPVTGPLALGFGCHFGLGLFRPSSDGFGAGVPA